MFTFYTVKNQDNGQYLCRVPQSVHDLKSSDYIWTDKIQNIKVYTKPGPARSAMTTISRICYENDIPKPNIVLSQLDTSETILDEGVRVAKAIQKMRNEKQQNQLRKKNDEIQRLQTKIADDIKKLQALSDS